MKKERKTLVLLLICFFSMMALVACGPKTHTVTFKDGDTVVDTLTVNDGEVAMGGELFDEVHNFVGWYDESGNKFDFATAITSDITLNARWTHTVKFLNYDDSLISKLEVEEGETIKAPTKNPVRPSDDTNNYTFKGWDKELKGTDSDMEIKAVFESSLITYKVTYYDNGELIDTKEIVKGQKTEAIAVNRENDEYYNYSFNAWYTEDGEVFDFNTAITKDTKLVARFNRTPVDHTSLTGMKVSLMGASISTFYAEGSAMNSYYSGNDEFYYPKYSTTVKNVTGTWWYKMINEFGLVLGVNQSLSGSAITQGSSEKQAQNYTRIRAMGENGTPDIIILFIGINDNVNGVKSKDFEVGYRTMLDRTMEVYPNAYIFVGTFYYSHYHIRMTSHGSYSETARLEYNEIIRKLASEYQVGLVDLGDVWEVGVSPTEGDSGSKGYLGDNLHPSAKGMTEIYKVFVKDMKAYFGIE